MTCAFRGAVAASLLATLACEAPPTPAPAAPPRTQRARAEGDVCVPTGAHEAHGRFGCQACHPCGGALSFDLPVRLPGGTTSAGGTFGSDANGGLTCYVGCHAPKGSPLDPISWNASGPLACTACHAPASLPNAHPPVLGTATRADCLACHLLEQHTSGTVVVVGHDAAWSQPGSDRFHAYSANAVFASCASCHGPRLAGGAAPGCATCHDAALPEGVASWSENCVMCHGGEEPGNGAPPSAAPPSATWGNGADAVRVGAHSRHLTAGPVGPAATCSDCHVTPADAFAPGHIDGGTAEVVFARAPLGATPAFDRITGTCSGTYCHGGGLGGGTHTSPVWTRLGQGEADCGACHGLPPPPPHPR